MIAYLFVPQRDDDISSSVSHNEKSKMKRNLIHKYLAENPNGIGLVSVVQKSGYKTLSINGKIHYAEWPLGTPTVDYFYKILGIKLELAEITKFQNVTRNVGSKNIKSIKQIAKTIKNLMESGTYEIEFYQDLSNEIHYHFDRTSFDNIQNPILDEFADKWWNKKEIEILKMEKIIDHPLEKFIDQYYSSWAEDYSYYISSQSIKSINFEIVNRYINEIRNGSKPLIIIADYSIILDGHHKAIAYSITNTKPYILRIRNENNRMLKNDSLEELKNILSKDEYEHFINEYEE